MTRYAPISEVESLKARVEALEAKQKPETKESSETKPKPKSTE